MADTIAWTCPYCNRDTTLTDANYNHSIDYFNEGNKDGLIAIITSMKVCPNPSCKEYALETITHQARWWNGKREVFGNALETWKLRPNSSAKPIPNYVPTPIVNDYIEACLIRDLSPKASATLSRRCLQGMIRDFWTISKSRLIDEIKALEDKIDPATWAGIDAVRSIGNIGAHMEKDINVIVDVEPEEAQLLIGLIEMLIKDWYIARHDREERMKGLIALAASKKPAQT